MGDDGDFAKILRQEQLGFQERRHAFQLRKLTFVAALFGLGSVHLGELTFEPVLYLIPIVAFLFDIHILMEDHAAKRIGVFLSHEEANNTEAERAWEAFVKKYPSPFSPIVSPLVTLLVLGGAAIMLWIGSTSPTLFWFWLFVNLVLITGLVIYWLRLRRQFEKKTDDK